MNFVVLAFLCGLAYGASGQGSIVLEAQKPLSGPDRRPSLDLNYNQRIFDNGRANANAFGGVNVQPGQPVRPQFGINAERNYNNGFLRGTAQGQIGPHGRVDPYIGITGGWRFKRDIPLEEQTVQEEEHRSRREANPQGSVVIQGQKPMSGPDRRPSLDVNYNQRVFDNGRTNANAFGGVNVRPGQPVRPQFGVNAERNYKNGFLRGSAQGQVGPHGRVSPSVGITGGWRFRRDIPLEEEIVQEEEEHRSRREANPQGSVVIQGQKPLSGPDRRPSLDVNYNQRVFDNGRTNANAFGGVNVRPGQPVRPQFGVNAERNYKNGFLRGSAQGQVGPHGRVSPSVGITGGWRFRRDIPLEEEIVQEEEHDTQLETKLQSGIFKNNQKPLSENQHIPPYPVSYNQSRLQEDLSKINRWGAIPPPRGPIVPQPGNTATRHSNRNWNHRGNTQGQGEPRDIVGSSTDPSDERNVEGHTTTEESKGEHRSRREANPQGSVVIQGQKPLSGPDRRPSLDVNYNQRVFDNGRTNANAFGGVNVRPGQPVRPQFGINAERNYKNGFLRGSAQGQVGPRGRVSPTIGITGGWRF
ncbi:uncharacterized protein [Prorops nasuta]|uniref:uncharacterized protein n=1 Tax=Prorops nasuta TaxID=863751 RepID=UPI0034CDF8F2